MSNSISKNGLTKPFLDPSSGGRIRRVARRHCLLASLVAIRGEGSQHTTQSKQKLPHSGEFCLLPLLDAFRTIDWEEIKENLRRLESIISIRLAPGDGLY